MLSIQNSSPLIPQLEISGLKSSDETLVPSSSSSSFDNNKVISNPDEHVLTKGPTINKFSIRDYVFKSRNKDIKNNWPFSEKSLQICLKNGVKHLLPPFQSIDSMKNHYNSCFDEEDEVVIVNNDIHQQEEPPIFPIPCSSSVIIKKPENTLIQPPPPPPPVKKCRVVNRVDPNSKELVDTMNFADHAMVSKICPVCKTFSSSSNTTLNAHIDQCLSTESSNDKLASSDPRPPPPTMISKNKIKPRKMRLMVDIYLTARHCTLEELDRRNGTNWATKPIPVREEVTDKAHHKEEKLSVSKAAVQKDNNSDDGEVYIDANGTKLRILSKSDDKPVEVSTTNKIQTGNKKRLHHRHHHMQKLQKHSKLDEPNSKKASFPKSANNLEIPRDPEMNFTSRRNCNVIEKQEKSFKAQQHKKDRNFTPIKKWACAKRTNFFNRTGRKEDSPQKLALECHSSDGPVMEKSFSNKRTRNSFESITPFSSPESSERIEKTCTDKVKQPLNRIGSFRGGLKGGDTHEIDDAGDGQPNELALDLHRSSSEKSKKFSSLRSEDNNSAKRLTLVKKRRRIASNSGEELEGIHIPSPQTVGSLSGKFRKEGDPQTSLSNSLVNPLCLLEDNMSDDHDRDMYNANHEMGNPLILDLEEDDHDRVITGNDSSTYFHGVDPIPIPGPPGSFLPSPSPMDHMGGEDELHGNNSSLTNTSQPESCENQYLDDHDHVDNVRDSSNSPTSLVSTISSRENFSKVNPPDATNNIIIHSEKLTDQLCCCAARKDQDVIWKQMSSADPNRIRLDHVIHGPNHESLKNLKLDPDLIIKFPINGECSTSVSPSSPNPVLRLMGKNLMVVNKDDNNSIQQQQQYRPQWISDSNNPIQQQLAVSNNNHMPYQQAAPVFNLSSEYNRVENQPFDHIRSYNNIGFDNPISHLVGSYNFVNDPSFRKHTPPSAAAVYHHHDPMKEIIVIDDTPEITKTDLDSDALMGGSGTRHNRVRPMVPANNINTSSREKILPFYRYQHQTQNSVLPYGGILPTTTNGSFQMPMMRLNRNSDGSSNMQTTQISPNLVVATTLPSAASHPGGMLYYNRGFS